MAIGEFYGNYDNFRWLPWFPSKLPKKGMTAIGKK